MIALRSTVDLWKGRHADAMALVHARDVEVSRLSGLLDLAERALAREAERRDRLEARYHELKLRGAEHVAPAVPVEPAQPDAVTQAIIAKAKGSPRLTSYYRDEYVPTMRMAGVENDDIAAAILKGETDDVGIPA